MFIDLILDKYIKYLENEGCSKSFHIKTKNAFKSFPPPNNLSLQKLKIKQIKIIIKNDKLLSIHKSINIYARIVLIISN